MQRLFGAGLRFGLIRTAVRANRAAPTNHTRCMPRSLCTLRSADPSLDDATRASAFICERGHPTDVAEAVVKTLQGAEWNAAQFGGLLKLATMLAGDWETDSDMGLKPLCEAIRQELAATAGKQMVTFNVRSGGGSPFQVQGYEGMSLKLISESGAGVGADVLGECLECACNGVMACSTCQVYVDPEWMSRVGEPGDDEEDMLELAYDRRDNSRLGCQIVLTPELEGMDLEIPRGANNMFDHIPFE